LLVRVCRRSARPCRSRGGDRRSRRARRGDGAVPPVHPSPVLHAREIRVPGRLVPGGREHEREDACTAVSRPARRGRPGSCRPLTEGGAWTMSVTDTELAARIDDLTAELQPLQKAVNEAAWELNVTGEERWQEEVARLSKEIRL